VNPRILVGVVLMLAFSDGIVHAAGNSSDAGSLNAPAVELLASSVASQRAVLRVADHALQMVDRGQVVVGLDAILQEVRPDAVVLTPLKTSASNVREIKILPSGIGSSTRVIRIRASAPRTPLWAAGNDIRPQNVVSGPAVDARSGSVTKPPLQKQDQ